eukprot:scaffold36842_cov39-Phaeocystis_antarctica.AAC.2
MDEAGLLSSVMKMPSPCSTRRWVHRRGRAAGSVLQRRAPLCGDARQLDGRSWPLELGDEDAEPL